MRIRDFSGKNILVVGGSEGIGLAIAKLLTRADCNLIIASRSEAKCQHALVLLAGGRATVQSSQVDVSNTGSVEALAAQLSGEFVCIDYLINCAGYSVPQYFTDLTVSACEGMVQTNYLGTVRLLKCFYPLLNQSDSPRCLLVSSVLGYMPLMGFSGYCASKAALSFMVRSLIQEEGMSKIRYHLAFPPAVDTPGLAIENEIKPAFIRKMEEGTSVLQPDRLAKLLLTGMLKNKRYIVPGVMNKFLYFTHRILGDALLDVIIKFYTWKYPLLRD